MNKADRRKLLFEIDEALHQNDYALARDRLETLIAATDKPAHIRHLAQSAGELLAAWNGGQGYASLSLTWGGTSELEDGGLFGVTVYRERDGKTFNNGTLTLQEVVDGAESLARG